jgi:transposase
MDYTINQFKKEFPDDNACLEYIFLQKYALNPVCPNCGRKNTYYRVKKRKCYACSFCAHQIHPTAGTIFEKSSTSLWNWFYAIYLFSASKNGLSSNELKRQIGVTYKCAWRIGREIRKLMTQETTLSKGVFEADETYIGGRIIQRDRYKNKAPIMGIVKRGGGIYTKAVVDADRATLMPIIRDCVEIGSTLITDEASVYYYAKKHYNHNTINHSRKEYVRGNTHTNTIEGFWSHFKNAMRGTYGFVSPKYLQTYLDEFSFRYNYRKGQIFSCLLKRLVG